MVRNCPDRPGVQTDALALIFLAIGLLILPLQWIGAACLAGLVHEFFHWAAVSLCGGRICHLRIGLRGAIMEVPPMSEGKRLLCSLAGPLGGLSLLLMGRFMPRMALCAAIQSAYNLLPVWPLDGGRALHSLTAMLFPPNIADAVCRFIAAAVCIFLLVLGIYAAFVWQTGFIGLLITVAAVAHIHGNSRKTPCKAAKFTIQ